MTRRNQSQRRRTYGRRQHEVRERRDESRPADAWFSETDSELDSDWQATDGEERSSYGESIGGFSR